MKKHLPLIGLIVLGIAAVTLGILWPLDHNKLRGMWVDAETRYTNYFNYCAKLTTITNELQTDINIKKKKIADLTDENKKLDDSLKATQGELETAKGEVKKLTDLVKENEEKATKFDEMKKEMQGKVDVMTAQLATAAKLTQALTASTNALTVSVLDWQAKQKAELERAEKFKKRLLDNKIPLEPDKLFVGSILVVNTEQEFLILDIGSDDLLPVGKELEVVRDNHVIATVVVKKLLPQNGKMAIATVKSLVDQNTPVKEGDQVKNVQKF